MSGLHRGQPGMPITAFGDVRVAELSPVFQGTFEYTVDNQAIMTQVLSGGTATQADGMGVVSTTTTTARSACLQSRNHAKYRSGLGGLLRFTSLFTTPVAGTEQYIGLADEIGSSATFKNGYMVGYTGTTFGLHRFSNDALTTVTQANWDDPMDGTGASGMTLDATKINVWFIEFQYLGAGAIKLWMEHGDGTLHLAHTIEYANQNIIPSVINPNFVFMMWVANKATTSNMIVKSSSYGYFVEGYTTHKEMHTPVFATGEQTQATVTTEVNIVTIRNKTAYVSKTNFIDLFMVDFRASVEASQANNLANVRLIKNATLGGDPSYTDIETSDSVVEFDIAGTTITGGVSLGDFPLAGKNDKAGGSLVHFSIILIPGDTLTIAGTSANSATINAGFAWHELF